MSLNDSNINREEMERKINKQEQLLREVFKKMDKNHDERIDESELLEFLQNEGGKDLKMDSFKKLFKTLDTNDDGTILM